MLQHARGRIRSALAPTVLLVAAALSLSLLAAVPAHAAPTTVATTVAATTASLSPAATAAQRTAAKAARVKARAAARAAYQANVRRKVVRLAKSKVGRARYVAGAAGPSRFDCSGLALYVWRQAAGKRLPHYSVAQAGATRNVSRRNLKRGDLVFFFGSGAHHVGIYIGHGKMVGAANPRSGIKVDRVFSGWYGQRYSGAGRLF